MAEEMQENKEPEQLEGEEVVEIEDAEGGSEESNGKKLLKAGLGFLKSIIIGVAIGVFLVLFVVSRKNVSGPSMNPTLTDGDVLFVQMISTYFNDFDRGDIVVLDGTDMDGYNHEEYLIKRIVGLPGETIKFENGKTYIKEVGASDFKELQEDYLPEGTYTDVSYSGLKKGYNEVVLKDDEYFCLGDNRGISNDSRILGPFTEDRIKGVSLIRVYPFSEFGTVK